MCLNFYFYRYVSHSSRTISSRNRAFWPKMLNKTGTYFGLFSKKPISISIIVSIFFRFPLLWTSSRRLSLTRLNWAEEKNVNNQAVVSSTMLIQRPVSETHFPLLTFPILLFFSFFWWSNFSLCFLGAP